MIVYGTRTGNVKNILDRVVAIDDSIQIADIDSIWKSTEPYFLMTYTDGLGQVPDKTYEFLRRNDNYKNMKAVICSGNINFGKHYCGAGYEISSRFKVPLLRTIDLRGVSKDINEIIKKYNELMKGDK